MSKPTRIPTFLFSLFPLAHHRLSHLAVIRFSLNSIMSETMSNRSIAPPAVNRQFRAHPLHPTPASLSVAQRRRRWRIGRNMIIACARGTPQPPLSLCTFLAFVSSRSERRASRRGEHGCFMPRAMCLCPSYARAMRHGAAVPGRPSPRRVRGRLTHSPPGPVSGRALLALLALTPGRPPISSLAVLSLRTVILVRRDRADKPRLCRTASAGCKLNVTSGQQANRI